MSVLLLFYFSTPSKVLSVLATPFYSYVEFSFLILVEPPVGYTDIETIANITEIEVVIQKTNITTQLTIPTGKT